MPDPTHHPTADLLEFLAAHPPAGPRWQHLRVMQQIKMAGHYHTDEGVPMPDHSPTADLLESLAPCPPAGSRWRHYRGAVCVVTGSAIDEGTLQPLVLYRHEDTPVVFARPLSSWNGAISIMTGGTVRRFVRVADEDKPHA